MRSTVLSAIPGRAQEKWVEIVIMTTEEIPRIKNNVRVSEFDSSFKEKSYLLTYDNNQWRISELIRDIINNIDGGKSTKQIHESINSKYQGRVTIEDVNYVINTLLREKGILAGTVNPDGKGGKKDKNLWLRISLIKSSIVQRFRFLSIFYDRRIFIPLGIVGIVSQIWMIINNANPIVFQRAFSASGNTWLYFLAIMIVVGIWHELGHSSACMHYGIEPGSIGAGIYYILPVFYSDVTRIWRLPRYQRVIVDLGGMYFQSMIMLVLYLLAIFFNNIDMKLCVLFLSMQMIFNFNPFIKMDGYWVLSDLIGIPNLQENMKSFMMSKLERIFRRKPDSFSLNIKKRERTVFHFYVFLSSIFLIYFSYCIFVIFTTAVTNLPMLYEAFNTANYAGKPLWEAISTVIKYFFSNLVYIITIFFVVRVLLSAAKMIRKSVIKSKAPHNIVP